MTTVTPQALDKLGGTWGPFEFKETVGTYHYYSSSWDTTSPPYHGTKVQSDSTASDYNIWSDSDTGHDPSVFTDNGDGTISLKNSSNTLLYKFTKPTSASWISSGGGTSTEGTGTGSTTPSGTVVKIGTSPLAATVKFTIDSSSPSSSGVISYQIFRDGVFFYTITGHTAGAPTVQYTGWYNSRWELRMVSTTGLYETQTLAFIGKEVNVSSNFW